MGNGCEEQKAEQQQGADVARLDEDGDLVNTADQENYRSQMLDLSARECQVMDCLVQGCTNKEIAVALNVSPSTVDTHLRRLFMKLGVHSRTAAVVAYLTRRRPWFSRARFRENTGSL